MSTWVLCVCTLPQIHSQFFVQAVENENELMQCMRARLGPYASETAIEYHLRSARGKVFWAGICVSSLRYADRHHICHLRYSISNSLSSEFLQ